METKLKIKDLDYVFQRKSKSLNDWQEKLPIPYSLKKVEESDKKLEYLKIVFDYKKTEYKKQ